MPLQSDSGDIPKAAATKTRPSRDGVPWHDKLLLLVILLAVTAWIVFRVATQLLGTLD